MRLSSLKHLIDSAQAISSCQRIIILGSSAFLPLFPELGEQHQILEKEVLAIAERIEKLGSS